MITKLLALGQFDFSRHLLVALAQWGIAVHYGFVGKPQFFPPETENLEIFSISRSDRARKIVEAVHRVRPDVIFVGSASYDASNRVALDLLEADPGIPIIRFYKEFVVKPSAVERRVLLGVDGLVAGVEREGLYFQAVYGLDRSRIHVLDPDLISSDLIPRRGLPKLSELDGRPHVVLGGNVKADDSEFDYRNLLQGLSDAGVHVHVYAVGFSKWLALGRALDPHSAEVQAAYADLWKHPFVHLEQPVYGAEQVLAWTQFDAGLTQRAPDVFWPELTPWQDMNLPSKYSYYLGAGLPIAVDRRALPSLRQLLAGQGVLVEYDDIGQLADTLRDLGRIAAMGARARQVAPNHTAQAGLEDLLSFVEGIVRRPRAVPDAVAPAS
jgi:hypothetical protein